jgi:Zn-dependent protease
LSDTLIRLLVMLPILLLSLVLHEVAHGYAAYLMGDPTAKRLGRLTLDPLAHLDPLGTLMIIWTMITGYGIGWAKPVPVNFRNFRNFRLGTIVVGIAGPLANILVALVFTFPFRSALISALRGTGNPYLAGALAGVIITNLSLAAFNLLPIPPLDGSHVVLGFLKGRLAYRYVQLERYGMFILLMLMLLGWLWRIVLPIVNFLGPLIMRWSGVPWGYVFLMYGTLL